MATDQLLLDFLTTDLPLTELAARHKLSLPDLLAWADSPGTQKLFTDLARIAAQRNALIAAESSAKALGNLAQLSHSLANRSELAGRGAPADPGAPKPPSITALETSRKACAMLLRILPRPEQSLRGVASAASNGPLDRPAPASHKAAHPEPSPQRCNARPDPLVPARHTTDNPSSVHRLTGSAAQFARPASRLAALAGAKPLSPSAPGLSPLPSGGIPAD